MSLQVSIMLSTLAIVVHQVISFPIKESDTTCHNIVDVDDNQQERKSYLIIITHHCGM